MLKLRMPESHPRYSDITALEQNLGNRTLKSSPQMVLTGSQGWELLQGKKKEDFVATEIFFSERKKSVSQVW